MSNDSQPQIAESMRLFNEALKKSAADATRKMAAFSQSVNESVEASRSARA